MTWLSCGPPKILGIESSCDETAAAVLDSSGSILSSVVASQLAAHARYEGVVPEIASREHGKAIVPVVRAAMSDAGLTWSDLSAVAVTVGPGLVGSLLVGATYAKSLSYARGLPLIAIHHVEGHIHAVILESKQKGTPVQFPALALVVSGGHTHLFSVTKDLRYQLLGKTRDDAAGEAFDKVGKLLGFGYPGGPVIDRLATHGNPRAVPFARARFTDGNNTDFSFSGLKTAVLRWSEAHDTDAEVEQRRALLKENPQPTLEQWLAVTPQKTLDAIASFQYRVITELLARLRTHAAQSGARSVIVSGGVACNRGLRQAALAANFGIPVHFPTAALATDNAVMIAAAAFPKFERGEFANLNVPVHAQLDLVTVNRT